MRIAWLLLLVACTGKGERPDGGTGEGGVILDGSTTDGSLACADDSVLEPNDTLGNAFATSVDTQNQMLAINGLALCPASDKDHYQITLSAMKSLEVIASWDSGPAVNLSLLNAGGTAIKNGSPLGTNATRVCVPNLPSGTYFGAVFGTMRNNYRLSINALASCP